MSQPLPRYDTERTDRRSTIRRPSLPLERIVNDAEDRTITTVARATLAGDERRLRGIPVTGRGIGSTVPGTDPLAALLQKERYAA